MAVEFKMPSLQNWSSVVGIDIAGDGLCYTLLRRTGLRLSVQKVGRLAFQNVSDETEGLSNALPTLMQQNPWLAKSKLIIGINERHCTVKQQSYPPLKKSELEQGMLLELQREMGQDSSGIVLGYTLIGPTKGSPGNNDYMFFGIMEENVNPYILPFSNYNVLPTKINLRILALKNLIQFLPASPPSDEAVGLLHVGNKSSLLVILKNGQVDFYRDIAMGTDDFSKSITSTIFHEGQAIQFTYEEAVKFKNMHGYPLGSDEGQTYKGAPLSELGAMMRPVMERLTGEIQRSLGFYGDKSGGVHISNLYLIGGGATLKHLDEVLNSRLNVSVSKFPVPKSLAVAGDEKNRKIFRQKFYEQAVSLALAAEKDLQGNLLPPVYKQRHLMRMFHNVAMLAGIFLIVLAGMFWLQDTGKITRLKKEIDIEEVRALAAETAEQRYAKAFTQRNRLAARIDEVEAKIHQDENIISVLKMLTHIVPSDALLSDFQYIVEKKMPVTDKKAVKNTKAKKKEEAETETDVKPKIERYILVAGESRKPKSDVKIMVGQMLILLQQSGYFSHVELVQEGYVEQVEEYQFDIKAILAEKSNE